MLADGHHRCLIVAAAGWAAFASAALPPAAAAAPTTTISVELELRSGGRLTGGVVAHDEEAIVIVAERRPFAFAWSEIRPQSAFLARRALLTHVRGSLDAVTAEDRFSLGVFALENNLGPAARLEFAAAERLNPGIAERVRSAYAAQRMRAEQEKLLCGGLSDSRPVSDDDSVAAANSELPLDTLVDRDVGESDPIATSPEVRRQVREIYDRFGATVIEQMGAGTTLHETEHFLIFGDLPGPMRQRVAEQAESMYRALQREFAFEPDHEVFLAKCPLFCWRSRARFQRFARTFDGQDGRNSAGYTRSIERNGHVHIVVYLGGYSEADFDAFVATLVHEGTHAFVHRLHSSRLIPHWVNEGLAEWTAEQVLGQRCPAREKADLLAAQYVRYDWPIGHFLADVGPIEVHDYPLAMSVVSHLIELDRSKWRRFMMLLKEGRTLREALGAAYDGMDLAALEDSWRAAVAARRVEADPISFNGQ